MKLTLISIILCALLVAALPQDTERYFREKCSNNQLSCCSNLKSTAEANGNTVDQNGIPIDQTVNSVGGISVAIAEIVGNTVSQVSNIVPISILSGCAPILGNSQITCVNYIACCVPRDDRDSHYDSGKNRYDDGHKCQVLRDTKVTRNPGLLDLP